MVNILDFSDNDSLEDLDNDEKVVPSSKAPKSKKDRKKKKEEELEEAQRELERMNIEDENSVPVQNSKRETMENTSDYIVEQNEKEHQMGKSKNKEKKKEKKVLLIIHFIL